MNSFMCGNITCVMHAVSLVTSEVLESVGNICLQQLQSNWHNYCSHSLCVFCVHPLVKTVWKGQAVRTPTHGILKRVTGGLMFEFVASECLFVSLRWEYFELLKLLPMLFCSVQFFLRHIWASVSLGHTIWLLCPWIISCRIVLHSTTYKLTTTNTFKMTKPLYITEI